MQNVIISERLSKLGVSSAVATYVDKLKAGAIKPLEFAAIMKATEDFVKEARAAAGETIQEELKHWPQGKATFNGVKIEKAEVGTKYDFSADPVWQKYAAQLEEVKTMMAGREALLKNLPKMIVETDPDTGEMFEVWPAVKTSTTGYKVTLPKE